MAERGRPPRRGDFITGDTIPVADGDPRLVEKRYKRGDFLTSDSAGPPATFTKRQPLSKQFEHFTEAAEIADRAAALDPYQQRKLLIAQLARRFLQVREQIDAATQSVKRGRRARP